MNVLNSHLILLIQEYSGGMQPPIYEANSQCGTTLTTFNNHKLNREWIDNEHWEGGPAK